MSKEFKFDVIIGNPPYQDNNISDTNKAPSIYPYFIDEAYKVGRIVELIHPARFLFNAGDTSKKWNKKMLMDPHLKVSYYEQNGANIFPNTDIKGGIAVTYHDVNNKLGPIITFTPFKELNSILHKVVISTDFVGIDKFVFNQNKFNLSHLYSDYPELENVIGSKGRDKRFRNNIFSKVDQFINYPSNDSIKVIGLLNGKRVWKYINKRYVDEKHDNLFKYKVLVPESNGNGHFGEIISNPFIEKPYEGYTQTFLGIGSLNTIEEARGLLRYIKSKFARTMLGTLKVTQHNPISTWVNVPMQDFTENSDIDWSKPISEIDQQLYKKYGLNQEEISFIETKVKEMD